MKKPKTPIGHARRGAIEQTRGFLICLTNPKLTPRVPRPIRRVALACLEHYPPADELAAKEPDASNEPD